MTIRIGIYTPFPANIGGGERFIMTLASAVQNDCEVDFLCHDSNSYLILSSSLKIEMSKVNFKDFKINSIFDVRHFFPTIEYDVFICICNSMTPPTMGKGKINIQIIQFPYRVEYLQSIHKSLKSKLKAFVKSKFKEVLHYKKLVDKSYSIAIVYSEYAKVHVQEQFLGNIYVVSPPVDFQSLNYSGFKTKKNQILSVGRFVGDQDSKRQLEMVQWFKVLLDQYPESNLQYYCVGGVSSKSPHYEYYQKVKLEAEGYPIYVLPNIDLNQLCQLYQESKYFWHSKGYNVEKLYPEFCEHFGISTVEAMYSGCIPLAYDAGGQREIINHNQNGFLWRNSHNLINQTINLIKNETISEEISKNAHTSVQKYSKNIFIEKIRDLIYKIT